MPKVQKNPGSENHFVTIPHDLRKAMGWEKGTELEFGVVDENSLKIEEVSGEE